MKREMVAKKLIGIALLVFVLAGSVTMNAQGAERFDIQGVGYPLQFYFDSEPISITVDPHPVLDAIDVHTVSVGTTIFGEIVAQNLPDDVWVWNEWINLRDMTVGWDMPQPQWNVINRQNAIHTFDTVGRFMVIADTQLAVFEIIVVPGQAPTPQPLPAPQPQPAAPSAWAVSFVEQAVAAGLVPQGLQSNYTAPTTRAEFAALAVALYETTTDSTIAGRTAFNDTTDVNVQKMGYLGVVTGVGGGSFAPNGQLTREQAAVMLARLADAIGQPLPQSAPTFADNTQISSWAFDAVGQAQAAGIMGGIGDNRFAPSGDYTREQSIVTILRLFELLN